MGLVSFGNSEEDKTEMKDYDPASAIQKELERKNRENEVKKFQQELDDAYSEEFEEARYSKPAQVVTAYHSVYGRWPRGHPLAG